MTLMCALLSACNPAGFFEPTDATPVYIEQWLESARDPSDTPNPAEFYYVEDGTSYPYMDDYDLKVRDIIKNGVSNTSGGQVKAEDIHKGDIDYVGYFIRSYIGRLNYCNIRVFDDGDIVTEAGGSGWGAPKTQYFVYSVGTTITSEIISKTKERYTELDNAFNEEYEKVKEEASIDKFFKSIEEAETKAYVSFEDEQSNAHKFYDDDGSILAELKELEYEAKDRSFNMTYLPKFEYYLTDSWKLNIYWGGEGANYDIASIDYVCEEQPSSYYRRHYFFYYSINQAKAKALITRISNN